VESLAQLIKAKLQHFR